MEMKQNQAFIHGTYSKCGTIFRWSINIQNINIRKTSFLFLLKKKKLKKKIINIRYLIIVQIKMRLLIFLVFSQNRFTCKYGIILQMAMYNWMHNCIFEYLAEQLPMRQGYVIQFIF